jgi:hypothetical protein
MKTTSFFSIIMPHRQSRPLKPIAMVARQRMHLYNGKDTHVVSRRRAHYSGFYHGEDAPIAGINN